MGGQVYYRRAGAKKPSYRTLYDKPIHRLTDSELDALIRLTFNARPLEDPRPGRREILAKAMLLGVDPCDLAEARFLEECRGDKP